MESCSELLGRVDPSSVINLFLSAIRFATSSPSSVMQDMKKSAKEQLEFLLTEDEDASVLIADDELKSEAKQCTSALFSRFVNLVDSIIVDNAGKTDLFQMYLSDLLWVSSILTKLESFGDFIALWVEISPKIVKIPEQCYSIEIKLKVLEVTSRVLDAMGYGSVIVSTGKRLRMVEIWLPYARSVKWGVDTNEIVLKCDGELWESLESSFVLTILTLPSTEQAKIITEWLESECGRYPDLTEAFEIWCYRSKVARRRMSFLDVRNSLNEEAL